MPAPFDLLHRQSRVPASALALVLASGAVAAPPVIYDLGVLPGGTMSVAHAISRDGKFVTGFGNGITSTNDQYAFRWSQSGGMVSLGTPTPGVSTQGNSIGLNGSWIAVNVGGAVGRWGSSLPVQSLGMPAGASTVTCQDISDSGALVVGTATYPNQDKRGFAWTSSGYVLMPALGFDFNIGPQTLAHGVSHDGQLIVGATTTNNYTLEACVWSFSSPNITSLTSLGTLPGAGWAEAWTISTNKQVVIGFSRDSNNNFHLFRHANSVMQDLGMDVSYNSDQAATNYDGKVIVGKSLSGPPYYWSTGAGMQNLNTYLAQLGTNMAGWTLVTAAGVSDDGTSIVGWGLHNGVPRAYLIRNMPCPSTPFIQTPPTARSVCPAPGSSATLAMTVDAPGELTYRWSVESPPGSGAFTPITEPFFADESGQHFRASGWDGPELTITDLVPAAGKPSIVILPEVANPCGPTVGPPTPVALCSADLACDGQVDDTDFVVFVAAYDALICPGGTPGTVPFCPGDLNQDNQVDDADFVIFAAAYDALLCV